MSFSSDVKGELAKRISSARHCQIAELAALMNFCGQYGRDEYGGFTIGFQTENEAVSRKGFTLLKKTYNIDTDIVLKEEQMQGLLNKVGDIHGPVKSDSGQECLLPESFFKGRFPEHWIHE